MTTIELLSHLRSIGVALWVEDDQLCFNAPKGALTPPLRAQLVEHKAEILTFLRSAQAAAASGSLPAIQPVARDRELPLSFAQQRLWFLDQLEPGLPSYNILSAVRLIGQLDAAALQQAINEIVRRHEALRTTFTAKDGHPVQVIAPSLSL